MEVVIGMHGKLRTIQGVAALVAALAIVVAACGGDDDSAADDSATTEPEQTTTTTVPTYDVEQVRAAVNAVTDVPEGYTIGSRCLAEGDPDCHEDADYDFEAYFVATNEGSYVPATNEEGAAATNDESSVISVSVLGFADAEAAAAQLADWRDGADDYDGSFDIPAEEFDDGNWSYERRGEGTVEDTEVGDWPGHQTLSVYDLYERNGELVNHVTDARLSLQRGNVAFEVWVTDVAEGATLDAVAAEADERAQTLVDELS